jgi:hypothetical protein
MTTPDNWRQLRRHPLSAEYKDLKGKADKRLLDSLRDHGFLPDQPITLHGGRVLDGWQRLRECRELGIEPVFQELPAGWTPEEYVAAVNDARRHEAPEIIERRAKERRRRVAAARAAGRSNLAIADQEGVSEKTIRNDVAALRSEGTNVDPPGGTITDSKGRKQPATKPQTDYGDAYEGELLCDRCQRVGAVQDCPKCKALQKGSANRKGTRVGPQKNGQQAYDWRPFRDGFGLLMRQIDKFGNLYGVKESGGAERLRVELAEFSGHFKEWYESVTGRPAPKG